MPNTPWPIESGRVTSLVWRVLLNKVPLHGCESLEIHSTNHRAASTLHAVFALDADPASMALWCDTDPPLLMEVQVSVDAYTQAELWHTVFVGEANDISIEPDDGTVTVGGRDLAGRLIDGKTRETFRNSTGSEIVAIVAGRFGMTADVDATTSPAGDFYELEHDKLTSDSLSKTTTYWDLLCWLAQCDDRDLWVDGTVVHYKLPVDLQSADAITLARTPKTLNGQPYPSALVTRMPMKRSCTLAKGIKVIVKSWSSGQKGSKEISYPTSAAKDAQEYVYIRNGWSPQRALTFAQGEYRDILRHERQLDIDTPGDPSITARSVIEVSGLPGATFNTRYAVDEVTSKFGCTSGFRQQIVLKNHKVQSQAAVG